MKDAVEVIAGEPEFRVVHHSVKRSDAKGKILGTVRYAADYELPGMLYAHLVRSWMPSARIVRRDATRARQLPGVVAVLFGEDVPNNEVTFDVPGQQFEIKALKASGCVLATERIRYHGEPIALVIASTEDVLTEAEALMDIELEELPGVFDAESALDKDAPLLHETGNLLGSWSVDDGDIDAALRDADIVVDGEYQTQVADPAYLEPEAGVAWLGDDGVLNIRVSTQVLEHYRDVARVLGVPESRVRVIAPYVGGGFGGKEDMTVEPYLGLATYRTGQPVKMVWTRQESLLARAKRHPVRVRYRTAAKFDGTITGQDVEVLADAGAYPALSAFVLLYSTITASGPYRSESVRVRARAVYTNNIPSSAFRGFGCMQVVLGYESQMDKLAEAIGVDSGELRKRNALRKGDRMPFGQPVATDVWLPQCIDAAQAAIGKEPQPQDERHAVGRGLACNIQPYGRLVWLNDTSSSWVGFEHDGTVIVRCGVPDVGGGQASSLAQIAAEVLGVEYEEVTVHFGDSALTPLAGTTTATRQLYMSGNATLSAATLVRDHVLDGVAEMSGLDRSLLRMESRGVVGPNKVIPIVDALVMCAQVGIPIAALSSFNSPRGQESGEQLKADRIYPDATFGAHVADVEVDLDTGAVRVIGYAASHDVGRAINPQSVAGQIIGGVAQGIGFALYERVILRDGYNFTTGFFQYAIPSAQDLPDIKCSILESGEGLGPFGAKGIGEPPIGPCAAAIASAIHNAIGVRPTRLPILAEDVIELLSQARG